MIWLSLSLFLAIVLLILAIGRWAGRRMEDQESVWGPRDSRHNHDPGFLHQLGHSIRGSGPR